nr:UPF0481 protein At3g47200-like [Ipomoea batatas]
MSNAMASHTGDNPQDQSSTNEKAKDAMIVDMEGVTHLQDSPMRILSEKLKIVKHLSSEACIFRVYERLRRTNPDAYTPLTISIGPYHHGKSELRKMERFKELYTQSLLERAEGVGVEECWKKLKELEGRAESYYGDEIDEKVSGDEFVKMLMLDGCFIVEFVIRSYLREFDEGQEYKDDPIYKMISGMESNILRENQLPFFVLKALCDMITPRLKGFLQMVKIAFESKIPKMNIISLLNTEVNPQEVKHLLQIVHILCQPPPQKNGQIQQQKAACSSSSCCFWKQPQGHGGSNIEPSNGHDRRMNCACFLCMFGEQPQGRRGSDIESDSHRHMPRFFTCFVCKFWGQPQQSKDEDEELLCSIRTASELHEAGVHFKKLGKIRNSSSDQTISLFDIKFNHGVLEIPSLALYDPTETFFRNLIAYEQHSLDVHPKYFTDYSLFMDHLINTEKDVNILRLKEVFVNGLGDDKEVTLLFNNLNKGVIYSSDDFYYKDVCKELYQHCKKPKNMLMAKLRRDYFHSPWAGISTFAAILLLMLTIAQTVLAALDHLHK